MLRKKPNHMDRSKWRYCSFREGSDFGCCFVGEICVVLSNPFEPCPTTIPVN
jgi:hypothetical protein